MRIWRPSVLADHVLGSLILFFASLLVVSVVALLIDFRSPASPLQWFAAAGLLALLALALIWLAVAFGLIAKSVETVSNLPIFLMLLPFFGSGFVPEGLYRFAPALERRLRAGGPRAAGRR